MTPKIEILDGVSEWIRKSIGTDAENRGQEEETAESDATDEEGDEDEDGSPTVNSPVCCSAASNTDVTVLET